MKKREQTTLHLITDSYGSVIGVYDQNRLLRLNYCPLGPVALSAIWTTLSFHNQLREKLTHSYLLGNGYRGYNPMWGRFDRPDQWSPFGAGGINTYAYGTADPINRVDPNGHASFIKRLGGWMGLKKSSQSSMKDIKLLGKGLLAFTDNPRAGRRINFLGHGPHPSNIERLAADPSVNRLQPEDLMDLYKKAGGNVDGVDSYRMLVCFSGAGDNAYARRLAQLVDRPTKGYQGLVSTSVEPNQIAQMITENSTHISSIGGKIRYKLGIKLYKSNPFSRNDYRYNHFSYMPRTFHPEKSVSIRRA